MNGIAPQPLTIVQLLKKLEKRIDNPGILERLIDYYIKFIAPCPLAKQVLFHNLLDDLNTSYLSDELSECWLRSFHFYLKIGQLDRIELFLKIEPELAKSSHDGMYSIISALQFISLNTSVADTLKILYEHGADFNYIPTKTTDKLSGLTPLAYCMAYMPEERDAINTMISYGADVNHASVINVINAYMSNINKYSKCASGLKSRNYISARWSCIEYILTLQEKKSMCCISGMNKLSFVNLQRSKKKIGSNKLQYTSDLSDPHHPRCLTELRLITKNNPKNPNSVSSLFVHVDVYKNNENLYDVINTEIYQFTDKKAQQLIFGMLIGDISPFSIYSVLKMTQNSVELENSALARFLYLSVGHSDYESKVCLKIIDDDLIKCLREKLDYKLEHVQQIIHELVIGLGIPKALFSD